ncbi:Hpt domain-containing protein [Thalassomonas actiniarum]|uniref:Hpt domain-containing protein n=1 Tax=Thalassomonas actiniarum TaxID=485447 RepID=A0AAE9YSJ6_9GAMM|nr:Hpt domain-containing protein [Thalassomonas actiniarum]WDD99513.1 Hpt domain-containing protein [Thalassomonas actiniarum]
MNKAAAKPLYRQFTPMLAAIFILASLILPLAITLMYLSEQQQGSAQQEQLAKLQRQNQYLQYRQKNQILFRQLLSETDAGQFSRLYQRLLDNWQILAEQIPDSGASDNSLSGDSTLSEGVKRLAAGSKRNIQLKQQSIIQLQLVADALDSIIFNKQGQLEQLYQQLQADNISDAVTVSRARAQGKIYTELARYNQLESLLAQLLVLFADLDLQFPLTEFEQLRNRAEELLTLTGELTAEQGPDVQLMALSDEMNKLSALLLTQQRTLAKWQGHLRLAHEFRRVLAVHRDKAKQLLTDKPVAEPEGKPSKQLAGIQGWLLSHTRGQPLFFAVSLFAGLAIAVFLLLVRLHLRLKAYTRQSLVLCEQLASGEQVNESLISSFENSRFTRIFSQMKKPEVTAEEVKRHSQGYRMQLKTLAQENHVLYWQQDGEFTLARQLNRGSKYLLHQAITVSSWRHAFPAEEVKKLTAAAREVKKSTETQNIRVFTHSGELLAISLIYRDHNFCGTIVNADVIAGYEQQLVLLNQELQEQQQARQLFMQQEHQQLHHLLTVAGLQIQSLSYGADISPRQLSRQLTRAADGLDQYALLAALKDKQLVMALQDVDLLNEIHAAMYNLMAQGRRQQNTLVLDCDPGLSRQVKLDVRLFHELLNAVYRLVLAGIFKGQLTLTVKLRDRHPGQQVVQVSVEVCSGQAFSRLPALLELLNKDEQIPQDLGGKALVEYFQLLLARHHGTNLLAELSEQGYRLAFDLPLALAKADEDEADIEEPAPLTLVCLSDNREQLQQVSQLLKPLKLDAYSAADELITQLTPGQLKSRPVDVVMVGEALFAREKDQLLTHINALPEALQPKLLVLQSELAQVRELVKEQGFYSPAAALLSRQNLLCEIRALMQQEAKTNLLFNPQICRQYAFISTEVEVLLGVKEPGKHQALISVLNWLGLQVRLAANNKRTQELWYGGRFLLLITEFEQPAFVDLDKGKAFERGLFSLPGGASFDGKESAKGWRLAQLPALSDLPALVAILRPWLKVQEQSRIQAEPAREESPQPQARIQENKPSKPELSPSGIAGYSPELQEYALQQQLFHVQDNESEVLAAFDLPRYTRHQHSAELAAYMLDEYLADNRDYLAQLTAAFQSRHFQQAGKVLTLLEKNAGILAADNLFSLCRQMQALAEQKHLKQADALLEQTRQELDAIENYAESI